MMDARLSLPQSCLRRWGVKGIAYVGAMEELRQRAIMSNIQRVGGAAAGGINAALIRLNYTDAEMRDLLGDLDFRKFLDVTWGIGRATSRLLREFRWRRGEFFREWSG